MAFSDRDDDSIYSLFALDIDGTMIGADRIVHADLVAAIGRVQSLGATVSIATGRALAPALRVAEQAGAAGAAELVRAGGQKIDVQVLRVNLSVRG